MELDPRFTLEWGREIYTGSQLLLKGALESAGGVHLLGGYPSAPMIGYFEACKTAETLLRDRGILARAATSEALAAAMLNGCVSAGLRGMVVMSGTGLHAAAEALAAGILTGAQGEAAAVVAIGDDPWNDSLAVSSDSRFMAQHLRLPLLEPASPQEIKDWVDVAMRLSRHAGAYVGYLLTAELAEGGGSVEVRQNRYPAVSMNERATLEVEKELRKAAERAATMATGAEAADVRLNESHNLLLAEAKRLQINRIENRPQRGEKVAMGFVAAGGDYGHLAAALEELGLAGRLPILRLGMSYPVDDKLVAELAGHCRQIFVVERRRGFVESQVRSIVAQMGAGPGQATEVWGKHFPRDLPGIAASGGLHPSALMERLVPLIRTDATLPVEMTGGRLTRELERIERASAVKLNVPARTPTFCAGCPHRDTSSVLGELRRDLLTPEYMTREHRRAPVELIVHGDSGCSSLLAFEPNQALLHRIGARGLGGAAAGGASPFLTNKQVVFMGDGAFFHSGQQAIRQSIAAGDDVTYIVLENQTSAMRGHTPVEPEAEAREAAIETKTPLSGKRISRMIQAMIDRKAHGPVRVIRVNPEDRIDYRDAMEKAILAPGVKIVIADKQCAIVRQRGFDAELRAEEQQRGFIARRTHMNIATEVCEHCMECTFHTACPGLMTVRSDYGPKIQTDLSSCVNDGACARMDVCPSFERVTVERVARGKSLKLDRYSIPDAATPVHASSEMWRCCIAGVGGMGVGVLARVLVFAGREMGYHVSFLPIKGIAVRTGSVLSEVAFTRDGRRFGGAVVPYGKADLLLAVDTLEGARAIDGSHRFRVASPDVTAGIVNTSAEPTTKQRMGREAIDPELVEAMRVHLRPDRWSAADYSELAERYMGDKQYVNVIMLGAAHQLGYLPLSLASIEEAIRRVLGRDLKRNLKALHIGRAIASGVLDGGTGEKPETVADTVRRKARELTERRPGSSGRRAARQYIAAIRPVLAALRLRGADETLRKDFAVRAADCMVWGGMDYARRYGRRVMSVLEKETASQKLALTRTVIWNLAKVMLIKDEIYVAALLRSPAKRKRDEKRFGVDVRLGDRLTYRRVHKPEIRMFGRRWSMTWRSREWQLHLLSGCRFIRTLAPFWHKREMIYREWYEQLVERCDVSTPTKYAKWLAVLGTPEMVTGFRDVRWPKLEAARAAAEALLAKPDDEESAQATEPRITVSLTNRVVSNP